MQLTLVGQTIFLYGRLLIPVRTTANRAAISRVKRKIYPRMYPITLVLANGATLQMRYHEPRHILQLPLNLDECSPEERQKRLLRRAPRSRLVLQEEVEDTFDRSQYEFLLKQ
ncbi:39S ribosomal protein L55 mitochondrial [Paragonimus heterotremus]|uniref:39S ribosomal protein L55 mitochondrial n=1 Tax=Paragonimus heterotremus TaxID=100268 RepID=A0A8J4T261_9TREM|nr:39S ribosomal protein L55 mitochondrial [Paragonimus heterotremus]